jgi:hypothetical protein
MLKEGELPKEVIQSEELAVDKTDKTDAADSEVKADPAVIVTTSDDGVTKESIVKPVAEVVEDEFEINGIKTKKVKAGSDEELDTHMNPYAKAYPNEKSFYATTDRQVFLSGNKTEAVEHQRTLDKSGTLTAYEL